MLSALSYRKAVRHFEKWQWRRGRIRTNKREWEENSPQTMAFLHRWVNLFPANLDKRWVVLLVRLWTSQTLIPCDWMPLWTKLIAEFPSGVNWMLSQLPLNFQLCFQPKLVLKLGVWAWSRTRKGWGQMMKWYFPKTLLSTEPLGQV